MEHSRSTALRLGFAWTAAAAFAAPIAARAAGAPIRIGSGTNDNMGEPYFALDGGFFARNGLDAQVTDLFSGPAMTAAVVGGSLDVTINNVGSIAAAHVRGLPIAVIAGAATYAADAPASTAVIVLKDSPIREARDFVGKTVACSSLRDLEQASMMAWLEKGGVTPTGVNFVELTNPRQLDALQAHRIDAAFMSQPWMNASLDVARIVAKPYDLLGSHLLLTAWIASTAWLTANQGVAARLVTAIKQTAQWANHNRAATAAIIEKRNGLSPETIAKMTRLEFTDRLDPALIQPIIDVTARYGFLPQSFPAASLFAA